MFPACAVLPRRTRGSIARVTSTREATAAEDPLATPRRRRRPSPVQVRWLAGALVVLAVVHAVVVGRHYFVGSFDDDASYILVSRALAAGHGLTSRLPAGYPLVSTYPPGYAALLAPLAWVSGSAFLAFRVLSVVFLAILLPLVWWYLGRRGLPDGVRLAVLALLALNPVVATFSTMVMAELPAMVAIMALLIAEERWEPEPGLISWAGAGTVIAAAASIWLKEAAVGLVAGVVVWLAIRKLWAKAATIGVSTGVLLAPVLIARLTTHTPLLGSRYSNEFGMAMTGGLAHTITSAVPHALSTYLNLAIPQSIVPTSVSPLPVVGAVAGALGTLGTTSTILVVIGVIVWARTLNRGPLVIVGVYLLETLAYPFINERRLILFLPLLLTWYVMGAWWVIGRLTALGRRLARTGPTWIASAVALVAWAPALVVVAILLPQFGRDYLFRLGQDSSRPQGSPYMAFLRGLGDPSGVVESDYLWTTNLFSGHPTAETAFLYTVSSCYWPNVYQALVADHAAYVLSGAFSSLPGVGSPCLLQSVASMAGAVRLYRTAYDDATVFELIGPGTPHPDLTDLLANAAIAAPDLGFRIPIVQAPGDPSGIETTAEASDGSAATTWTFAQPSSVDQVSVGVAEAIAGSTTGVTVELLGLDGRWFTVAQAPGAVGGPSVPTGDGARHPSTPYLLNVFEQPVEATAMRVTIGGTGRVSLLDVHVLGAPAVPANG